MLDERAPVDVGAGLDVGAGVAGDPALGGAAADGRAAVDIRAEVTPEVLARIGALGGDIVNSVPRYRSIRARLPLAAVEALAEMDAVRSIRPADEAATHQAPGLRSVDRRAPASAVRSKVNTSEGDVAHNADQARLIYGIDGTGIGIGVLSNGVDGLARRQRTGDLPERITVLPGQAGWGNEGTAMLEIVHDLAPGADLYFASAKSGQAQFAVNIEALCAAGADVIVDDMFYFREGVLQDGVIVQGINAAVADGCFYFSAAGNAGNLNDGTSGVWEGDYAAGEALTVNGEAAGVLHDFGGGRHENRITRPPSAIILQWADPLGASANDYDLFVMDRYGNVIASSTTTQSGWQDPIEHIPGWVYRPGARLVVVKASGADRYLRLSAIRGELQIATAGNTFGHSAAANAIGVAAVDARTADVVFDGSESVRTFSSDGPRRMFFQPDGAPITADDFSSTGGTVLQKPDLAAADGVSTATPGFGTFSGTSAAAPHAAAIAALLLEAAGGAGNMTPAELRAALAGSALDIEAAGVDRDSGAGIVMALDAVDAVAVAPADRNRAPTATGTLGGLTLAPGAGAVTIDLATRFADPEGDTLTYAAWSSQPRRVAAALTGSLLRLTPVAPSRAVVRVRATDPDGFAAVRSFSVTVTVGDRDYDLDDDGLIDIATLAQLDAVRYDLDGDGAADVATDWRSYDAAFPEGAIGMGCVRISCFGYELTADLDFDTNGSGAADAGDAWWNDGAGWRPIGGHLKGFRATFEGNRHTIANLFIERGGGVFVGLFGRTVDYFSAVIRNLGLVDVDVTGRETVGGLVGSNRGVIAGSFVTGRVAGDDHPRGRDGIVGGLVGANEGDITASHAAARVAADNVVGGLAGYNRAQGTIIGSYATGRVVGDDYVGGLVGSNPRGAIVASYATGDVLGDPGGAGERRYFGGLAGQSYGTIVASYATGLVAADNLVGGLVGQSHGTITASYATGRVVGGGPGASVGGLVGEASPYRPITASYWDTSTSGHETGGRGRTTAALQAPTGYGGIYAAWNRDLNRDGASDDPWDFGTAAQYPVLSMDVDRDGQATWQEFGYQLRAGPTLTATTAAGQGISLAWTAVDTSAWTPAPDVTYTVTRDDGAKVESIAADLGVLRFTDDDAPPGAPSTYQVVAVVNGGQATRSAAVALVPGMANQPPRLVRMLGDRTLHVGAGAAVVDLSEGVEDADGDPLTYSASSSDGGVAMASVSGSRLTLSPVAPGRATITVTATDAGGSNTSVTQRFVVEVWTANGTDYDPDDDGLIAITTLDQLDAVRHDLDGDGTPTVGGWAAYVAAFADAADGLGCGRTNGCAGYELAADLDFDTNGSGGADRGDAYWNAGRGWNPLGEYGSDPFSATFEGNGHVIRHLFSRHSRGGLFGRVDGASIRRVGLIDVDVQGRWHSGGLVAYQTGGEIHASYVTGVVSGRTSGVGGLVGWTELCRHLFQLFHRPGVRRERILAGWSGSVGRSSPRAMPRASCRATTRSAGWWVETVTRSPTAMRRAACRACRVSAGWSDSRTSPPGGPSGRSPAIGTRRRQAGPTVGRRTSCRSPRAIPVSTRVGTRTWTATAWLTIPGTSAPRRSIRPSRSISTATARRRGRSSVASSGRGRP